MWELRWILLTLGILLMGFLYLLGRGVFRRSSPPAGATRSGAHRNKPPKIGAIDAVDDAGSTELDADPQASGESEAPGSPARPAVPPRTDRIITIRFIPKEKDLNAERVVLALRKAGLTHGRYGIFHRVGDRGEDSLFAVANLTEPGSFELTNLSERVIPGMSFFMILPGPADPVTSFDLMVQTARSLAHDLEAELHDEKGSSWSIQRERYVREEIIRYRHQLEQP
jgi:cell division protein ZipA